MGKQKYVKGGLYEGPIVEYPAPTLKELLAAFSERGGAGCESELQEGTFPFFVKVIKPWQNETAYCNKPENDLLKMWLKGN